MREIHVTKCGNCLVFEAGRCKRLGTAVHESEPPCDWAVTGVLPDDFMFTAEESRNFEEWRTA